MKTASLLTSAALIFGLLSGCSSSEQEGSELAPYHREAFDYVLENGPSEGKARDMISDYWITDAEWNEMISDYLTCMENNGTEGTIPTDQLVVNITKARQAQINREYRDKAQALEQINKEIEIGEMCGADSILAVGLLYLDPRKNPEGLSHNDAVVRCFKESGYNDLDGLNDQEIADKLRSNELFESASDGQLQCISNPSYGEWHP